MEGIEREVIYPPGISPVEMRWKYEARRLRDEFAKAVLPALYTQFVQPGEEDSTWQTNCLGIARSAYDIADAMLDERKRREQST